MYMSHVHTQRIRVHPAKYSFNELYKFVTNHPNFNQLYINWCNGGYRRDEKPSCDRIDENKGYTLDNLTVVTWRENALKGFNYRKLGINNKINRCVVQYDLGMQKLNTYYSIAEAGRQNNIPAGNINKCVNGNRKTAGGFIWKAGP